MTAMFSRREALVIGVGAMAALTVGCTTVVPPTKPPSGNGTFNETNPVQSGTIEIATKLDFEDSTILRYSSVIQKHPLASSMRELLLAAELLDPNASRFSVERGSSIKAKSIACEAIFGTRSMES